MGQERPWHCCSFCPCRLFFFFFSPLFSLRLAGEDMCPVLGLPALHVAGCLLAAPSLLSPRKHKFQNVTQLGQGVRGWTLCVRFAGRLLHLKKIKNKKVCAIPLCQTTNPGVLYEPSWASDIS